MTDTFNGQSPEQRPWRLIISDVEGCVVPAARGSWDLASLKYLARYVDEAKGGKFPPIVLSTGRPAQYLEAVTVSLGLELAGVCENGGVLYDPKSAAEVPLYEPEQKELMEEVGRRVNEALVAAPEPWAEIATGKSICLSIIAPPGGLPGDGPTLEERVIEALGGRGGGLWEQLYAAASSHSVDLTPAGVNKSAAMDVLTELWRVADDEVIAFGDGDNDLTMLTRAGLAGAPANALPQVKAAAHIVAAGRETKGLLEVLSKAAGFSFG